VRSALLGLAAFAILPLTFTTAPAQTQSPDSATAPASAAPLLAAADSTSLPEDPSAGLASAATPAPASATNRDAAALPADAPPSSPQTQRAERAASIHMKYIPAGWSVISPLSTNDKVVLGLKDLYNPLNFAAMFASAGYEQVVNGSPNYGVDRGAFGERLGAAAIRESTQGIFTDAVFSPLLHEDPRYYVEGPQYSFIHRTFYAITRPLVTRTDSGSTSVNGAMLLGYAASSALSYTYYPQINQNFHDTAATFGSGLGGAALGFFVTEFSTDVLHKLHLARQP
jgi:hypothetical protein